MKSYFVSYMRGIFRRDLSPLDYAAQGKEYFFENAVINSHPIDWIRDEKSLHPSREITILFWSEIDKQQMESLEIATKEIFTIKNVDCIK